MVGAVTKVVVVDMAEEAIKAVVVDMLGAATKVVAVDTLEVVIRAVVTKEEAAVLRVR